MYEIRLDGALREIRIALLKNNILLDAAIWHPDFSDQYHDIHQVRILKNMPSLGGAFVSLENGEEAFLTSINKKNPPQEGSLLIAQIVRSAQNNKNLRLKPYPHPENFTKNPIPSKPQKLAQAPSPLEEIAAFAPNAPLIYKDASLAAFIPPYLRPRLKRETDSFESDLQEQWAQIFETTCFVPPLTAHIIPTPALISIDLDTNGLISPSKNDFELNLAAFPALLRQIRLRNLSGTILIDPAGVKTKKRAALLPFIEKFMKEEADPLCPQLSGITPAGLIEITRPHKRPALYEIRTSPHGKIFAFLETILREKHIGNTLYCPPEILALLQKHPHILEDFTCHYGKKITLKASAPPAYKSHSFTFTEE